MYISSIILKYFSVDQHLRLFLWLKREEGYKEGWKRIRIVSLSSVKERPNNKGECMEGISRYDKCLHIFKLRSTFLLCWITRCKLQTNFLLFNIFCFTKFNTVLEPPRKGHSIIRPLYERHSFWSQKLPSLYIVSIYWEPPNVTTRDKPAEVYCPKVSLVRRLYCIQATCSRLMVYMLLLWLFLYGVSWKSWRVSLVNWLLAPRVNRNHLRKRIRTTPKLYKVCFI